MGTRRLGKYEIVARLGRGGMAEVYRAYQPSLDRFVAIKVLHAFLADDPDFRGRFEKEARNIARLKHPNIVQVYDFDMDPDSETYYMVMELVEGPTLKDLLTDLDERGEQLPVRDSLKIAREAASALSYAHSQGMIHRDVKPANLMLEVDADARVVLTDFGIAKIVKGVQFTASGGMVGTPAYMAPEQGLGDAGDERSDLYSLGIIIYQMVTGRLPYDGETPLSVILKHLNEPIPSARDLNPQVPEEVDLIITRLMAKEPEERYQNALEVIADLERVEQSLPVSEGRPLLLDAEYRRTAQQGDTLSLGDEADHVATSIKPRDAILDTPALPESATPPAVPAAAAPPRRRFPWTAAVLVLIILGLVALLLLRDGGPLAALIASSPTPTPTASATSTPTGMPTATITPTPSFTPTDVPSNTPTFTMTSSQTPSETPTATVTSSQTPSETPTATWTPSLTPSLTPSTTPTASFTPSSTFTSTPSNTATATSTWTSTFTPTSSPTLTLTPTIDVTLTLLQSTLFFDMQTATVAACDYGYAIIEQVPADGEYAQAGRPYERAITLLNTGNCPWERNTSLVFVSGDSFNATPPYFFIRDRVNVGEEVTILFRGRAPTRSGVQTGVWELRTPGQLPIGDPIPISINVYQGG